MKKIKFYKRCYEGFALVEGELLYVNDKPVGITRETHNGKDKRKFDYTATDIDSGLRIATLPRKCDLLKKLADPEFMEQIAACYKSKTYEKAMKFVTEHKKATKE